ncbi:MAG: cell division protein FtsQ/DivIB [Planctomycetota bacterium]
MAVLAIVCLFAASGIGFAFLEEYVKQTVPISERINSIELVGVPAWANEQLKARIQAVVMAGGKALKLDEDFARTVQGNLSRDVAWLDEVRVQTAPDSIRIAARWRKPVALVQLGLQKFYVDADLVVLDFMPALTLPIVEVEGLSAVSKVPSPGAVWRQDDLAAAVAILDRLNRMDRLVIPDRPLLYEIETIDVSNFNGRRNSQGPHIVLYAKDNTEIIWGAEIGAWQQHLEATDEEKLAKLYGYYEECGTLLNGVKYINLRDPQETVPLPVDRY